SWDSVSAVIDNFLPDLIINDRLDTTIKYMKQFTNLKTISPHTRILNFEDLGDGTSLADGVINALYETTINLKNHYFGYKYVCIKEMFRYLPIKKISQVRNILVTFGGTDPSNLTMNIIRLLTRFFKNSPKGVAITVIIGPGYDIDKVKQISTFLNEINTKEPMFTLKSDIKEMALEMHAHDLVISSNGRTVYEAVSLGLPVISFAQNERETRHLFAEFAPCVLYLGRFSAEKEGRFNEILTNFLNNPDYLQKRNSEAIKFGQTIRKGIRKIIKLIELGE
ncbi:MAG: hypothetical protein KAR20_19400, partial [Candidatus Heimdallarchaeota archaeon]|nr:hypothetical protein [Candidatus Heimdallarchaeota archaeon]